MGSFGRSFGLGFASAIAPSVRSFGKKAGYSLIRNLLDPQAKEVDKALLDLGIKPTSDDTVNEALYNKAFDKKLSKDIGNENTEVGSIKLKPGKATSDVIEQFGRDDLRVNPRNLEVGSLTPSKEALKNLMRGGSLDQRINLDKEDAKVYKTYKSIQDDKKKMEDERLKLEKKNASKRLAEDIIKGRVPKSQIEPAIFNLTPEDRARINAVEKFRKLSDPNRDVYFDKNYKKIIEDQRQIEQTKPYIETLKSQLSDLGNKILDSQKNGEDPTLLKSEYNRVAKALKTMESGVNKKKIESEVLRKTSLDLMNLNMPPKTKAFFEKLDKTIENQLQETGIPVDDSTKIEKYAQILPLIRKNLKGDVKYISKYLFFKYGRHLKDTKFYQDSTKRILDAVGQ